MKVDIVSFGGINETKNFNLVINEVNNKRFLSLLGENLITIDKRLDEKRLSIVEGEEVIDGISNEYQKEYILMVDDKDQPFCITNNNKNMNIIALKSDIKSYRDLIIVIIDKECYRPIALDTEMLFSDIRGSFTTERYIIGVLSYSKEDVSRLILKLFDKNNNEYIEKSLIFNNGDIAIENHFIPELKRLDMGNIDKKHGYQNRRFKLSFQSFCPFFCVTTKENRIVAESIFEEYKLKDHKIFIVNQDINDNEDEQNRLIEELAKYKCKAVLSVGIRLNFDLVKKSKIYYLFTIDDTFKVRCVTQRI